MPRPPAIASQIRWPSASRLSRCTGGRRESDSGWMSAGNLDCPPSTATDAMMAMSPSALLHMMSASVLDFAAARRQHQLDDFLGDLRLEAFGMPFVDTHDIGDNAPVLAFAIRKDVGLARTRTKSPCLRAGILTRPVEHIAGLGVDDLASLRVRRAFVFLRACRRLRQLADLVLAGFEDVREVAHRR